MIRVYEGVAYFNNYMILYDMILILFYIYIYIYIYIYNYANIMPKLYENDDAKMMITLCQHNMKMMPT